MQDYEGPHDDKSSQCMSSVDPQFLSFFGNFFFIGFLQNLRPFEDLHRS